jgi:hypothetical protein
MRNLSEGHSARKHPTRIKFVGIYGFRRRRKWGRPFTVLVYHRERIESGTWR